MTKEDFIGAVRNLFLLCSQLCSVEVRQTIPPFETLPHIPMHKRLIPCHPDLQHFSVEYPWDWKPCSEPCMVVRDIQPFHCHQAQKGRNVEMSWVVEIKHHRCSSEMTVQNQWLFCASPGPWTLHPKERDALFFSWTIHGLQVSICGKEKRGIFSQAAAVFQNLKHLLFDSSVQLFFQEKTPSVSSVHWRIGQCPTTPTIKIRTHNWPQKQTKKKGKHPTIYEKWLKTLKKNPRTPHVFESEAICLKPKGICGSVRESPTSSWCVPKLSEFLPESSWRSPTILLNPGFWSVIQIVQCDVHLYNNVPFLATCCFFNLHPKNPIMPLWICHRRILVWYVPKRDKTTNCLCDESVFSIGSVVDLNQVSCLQAPVVAPETSWSGFFSH